MRSLPVWTSLKAVLLGAPVKTLMVNYLIGAISLFALRKTLIEEGTITKDLVDNVLLLASLASALISELFWIAACLLLFCSIDQKIRDYTDIGQYLERLQKYSGMAGEEWRQTLIDKTSEWNDADEEYPLWRAATLILICAALVFLVLSFAFLIGSLHRFLLLSIQRFAAF